VRLYAVLKTDIEGHAEVKQLAATEAMAQRILKTYRSGDVDTYRIIVLDVPTLEDVKNFQIGSIADAPPQPATPVEEPPQQEQEREIPVILPVKTQEEQDAPAKPKPRRKKA